VVAQVWLNPSYALGSDCSGKLFGPPVKQAQVQLPAADTMFGCTVSGGGRRLAGVWRLSAGCSAGGATGCGTGTVVGCA